MTTTLASPPQAATFDLDTTCRFGADALAQSPDYRRAVSRADPLAFALRYPRITCAETAAGSRFRSST